MVGGWDVVFDTKSEIIHFRDHFKIFQTCKFVFVHPTGIGDVYFSWTCTVSTKTNRILKSWSSTIDCSEEMQGIFFLSLGSFLSGSKGNLLMLREKWEKNFSKFFSWGNTTRFWRPSLNLKIRANPRSPSMRLNKTFGPVLDWLLWVTSSRRKSVTRVMNNPKFCSRERFLMYFHYNSDNFSKQALMIISYIIWVYTMIFYKGFISTLCFIYFFEFYKVQIIQ